MEACVATYPVIQLRFKVSSAFAAAAETMHFRMKCCQASNPHSPPPLLDALLSRPATATAAFTLPRQTQHEWEIEKKNCSACSVCRFTVTTNTHTHTPSCRCCTCCKRVQVRTALAKQKYKLRQFRGDTRHPRIIQSRVKIYMEIPQKHEDKSKKEDWRQMKKAEWAKSKSESTIESSVRCKNL